MSGSRTLTAPPMPRATIIHNPTAGDGALSADRLVDLVRGAGYETVYATTDDDLDSALQDPGDLAVAVGGDGTVGRVAARLVGSATPLAILPRGTANNVARSLGVVGDLATLVAGWPTAARRTLDVPFARGPWGKRRFVESFGLGLFADVMPLLEALKEGPDGPASPSDALRHDRRQLAALLRHIRPRPFGIRVDGGTVAGSHLLIEVMNVSHLGPNLPIAPGADPSDRRLDIVLLETDRRADFQAWLRDDAHLTPPVERRQARLVELTWLGDPLHMDGQAWGHDRAPFQTVRTARAASGASIAIALERDAVTVLVPAG